jgi:hypothetical protein
MSMQQTEARTFTVTGPLGRFAQGDVLKSDDDIVDYYRNILAEGGAVGKELTDPLILAVVRSVAGDGEDAEVERVEKLELLID